VERTQEGELVVVHLDGVEGGEPFGPVREGPRDPVSLAPDPEKEGVEVGPDGPREPGPEARAVSSSSSNPEMKFT
jgi:hypothetical protein